MSEWEWPQWAMAIPLVLNVVLTAALHGKERTVSDYNVLWSLVGSALTAWILYEGGFWT